MVLNIIGVPFRCDKACRDEAARKVVAYRNGQIVFKAEGILDMADYTLDGEWSPFPADAVEDRLAVLEEQNALWNSEADAAYRKGVEQA